MLAWALEFLCQGSRYARRHTKIWAEITGEAVMVVNNSNGVVVGLVVSQNALNGIQGGLCHKPNHPFGHRTPTCNQNPKFATKGDSNNFISINIENLYI